MVSHYGDSCGTISRIRKLTATHSKNFKGYIIIHCVPVHKFLFIMPVLLAIWDSETQQSDLNNVCLENQRWLK